MSEVDFESRKPLPQKQYLRSNVIPKIYKRNWLEILNLSQCTWEMFAKTLWIKCAQRGGYSTAKSRLTAWPLSSYSPPLSPMPGRIALHRVGSGPVDLSAQILPSYDVALQSHSLGILRTLYIGMSVVTSWWFQQLYWTLYICQTSWINSYNTSRRVIGATQLFVFVLWSYHNKHEMALEHRLDGGTPTV